MWGIPVISHILIIMKARIKMQKQQFDIGTYFTIKYYADKHSKTITRRGQFTKECEFGNHKVHGFPYFKYFDVDANGIRCASKSWKISEVSK